VYQANIIVGRIGGLEQGGDTATGPCAGRMPNFATDTITDFHVGGDSIMVYSTWLSNQYIFRATLAQDAGSGWQQMTASDIRVVMLSHSYACDPSVPAPPGFAGSKGIIQVIANTNGSIAF
jgi:hypothetical protein